MTTDTGIQIALSVPPLFHISLRGARPPIPITVQRLSMHPIEVRVTADIPAVPGGETWGYGRPIAVLDLRRAGQQQTIMWVPPLLPSTPTYSVLVRANGAKAVVKVIGAPDGTESEITGSLATPNPHVAPQFVQLSFLIKPHEVLAITSSSVRQLILNAFQLSQQTARPVYFRLWAWAERQGGIPTVWHYLLHCEYQGDLRDMSRLASAFDQAAGLAGIGIRTRVATWGGG